MEKKIEKYWKLVLIVTIIILVLIPINIMINKDAVLQVKDEYINQASIEEVSQINELADLYVKDQIVPKLFSTINVLILLVYPVLLSVKLINKIKNEKLTKEDFVIQIVCMAVPYIINAIILFIIKIAGGINNYLSGSDIIRWMIVNILVGVLIAEISNLIGIFSKKQSTHLLSVYGFLFIPILIIFSVQKLLQIIICGYVGFSDLTTNIVLEWPGLKILSLFSYDYEHQMYMNNFGIMHCLMYVLIISGIIYLINKWVDKKKEYNFVPMITIYGILFFITVIFIGALSQIINIALATLIALIISGIIYLIILLFLKGKNAKKLSALYGIYSLVIFIFVMIVQNNILGYETNIPNIDEIDYAVFSTANPLITDPIIVYKDKENIQYILDKQKQLVEEQTTIKNEKEVYYRYYIQYCLKNGKKITRAYDITKKYEDIYYSNEFLNQRYSYILDEELNKKLTKLSVIGVYKDNTFDITVTKDEELFTEIISAISKDIRDSRAYIVADDAYGKHGNGGDLSYVTVDISINDATSEDYMSYATINEDFELIKIIQNAINDGSQTINWGK